MICSFLKRCFSFTYEEWIVDPFDVEDMVGKLRSIGLGQSPEQMLCNITCGTKLMAFAAFQTMSEKHVPCLYVDTDNGRMILIHEGQIRSEAIHPRLTVTDFVQMTGAEITDEQTSLFRKDERLSELTALIYRNQ